MFRRQRRQSHQTQTQGNFLIGQLLSLECDQTRRQMNSISLLVYHPYTSNKQRDERELTES